MQVAARASRNHVRLDQRRQLARGADERPRGPSRAQRLRVAAGEVDGVHVHELVPRESVGAAWDQLVAEEGDRALAARVDVRDCAALRLGADRGSDANVERLELHGSPASEGVVSEGGDEQALAGEGREHHRSHRSAAGRLGPGLLRMDDVAGLRQPLDADEIDPFDVTDDRDLHAAVSHSPASAR